MGMSFNFVELITVVFFAALTVDSAAAAAPRGGCFSMASFFVVFAVT